VGKFGLLDAASTWTQDQKISKAAARLTLNATTGEPALALQENGVDKWLFSYNPTLDYCAIGQSGVGNHLIFKDGGNVGIGTVPSTKLHVLGVAGLVTGADYDTATPLVVENNGNCYVNIISSSASSGRLLFSDDVFARGQVVYDHAVEAMSFNVASSVVAMTMASTGAVNIPYIWTAAGISGTAVVVSGDGTLRKSSSSLRYKEQVKDLAPKVFGDEFIKALRPVTYRAIGDKSKRTHVGLIAEEVQAIGGGAGEPFIARNDEGLVESLHYERLVAPLVGAVQRLLARVEVLEGKT